MLKTCHFKSWREGDKSNTEKNADLFCADTRHNALAVLTNPDLLEKLDLCVPPIKITHGHWNRYGSIGYPWLPISVPYINGPISYRYRGKGRLHNFPTPSVYRPHWRRISSTF